MKHLTIILLVLVFSCKKEEKQLVYSLEQAKKSNSGIYEISKSSALSESKLNKLKIYFDNSYNAGIQFLDLAKESSFSKTVEKYLEKDENERACEKLFISKYTYRRLIKKCDYHGFNICPYSFSSYKDLKNQIISYIRSSVESSLYAKTKCSDYRY